MSTLVATLEESSQLIKVMEFDKMDWAKHVNDLEQLSKDIGVLHVNDLEQLSKDIGVLNVRGENTRDWQQSLKRLQDVIADVEKTGII